jgi:hypothetical protein
MTFQPKEVSLWNAWTIVRKRCGLAEDDLNPIPDAIREGALKLYYEGAERGWEWFKSAEVLVPKATFGLSELLAALLVGQISGRDIFVHMADLDRLWPGSAAVPREMCTPTAGAPVKNNRRNTPFNLARKAFEERFAAGDRSHENLTHKGLHFELTEQDKRAGGRGAWSLETSKRAAGRR